LKYELIFEQKFINTLIHKYPWPCQLVLRGEQETFKYLAKHILKVNDVTDYLMKFNNKLKRKYKGSLVKVENIKTIEPNAKKYLNNLAKVNNIEKISWGWYWVPSKTKDFFDFLRQDKNFKIITSQTAASFWNYDFIHRDTYAIKVINKSFGKALHVFCTRKGWDVKVEYIKPSSNIKYSNSRGLLIEDMEDNIIDCLKNWAFTDAFATIYENKNNIDFNRIFKRTYWMRISRSKVRIKQALEYGCSKMNEAIGRNLFPSRVIEFTDQYIKREIDESIEKVMDLA
jgi:hypothetical protein